MSPPGDSKDTQTAFNGADPTETIDSIVLLDGGFATQLSCHVQDPIDGDILWSARFLETHPEAVIEAHLDFLRAGADVIMTNTYQASIDGFVKYLGLTPEQSYSLIKKSVDYTRIAWQRFLKEYPSHRKTKPLIAGSVGPYGASLHDGSEYSGSYIPRTSLETMREWHRPRINALVEAGVDILALETIPSIVEAEMLIDLIKTDYPDTKAWLTFSVRQDGKSTAFGEDFQSVARQCYDSNRDQLLAVGINCVAPRLVESFFKGINDDREGCPVPLIVYPNSGETYKVELGWIDRDKCEPVATYVQKWLDIGITWIGGCCRTYAADISRIGVEIRKWLNKKERSHRQAMNGSEICCD